MTVVFFERDWYSINEAVLRICSTNSVPLLQKVTLDCLNALVPCDQYTFFLSLENDRKRLCNPAIRGVDALFVEEFLAGKYDSDEDSELFFSGRHLLSHNTETTRDSDFVPEDYLVNTKIYREMYKPQNIHYAIRSSLLYRRRFVGTIELFNSKKRGDFSDKQLRVLSTLAPHVANHLGVLMEFTCEDSLIKSLDINAVRIKYSLTLREAEIIEYVARGLNDQDISEECCVSESTVKKHLYNAFRKMNVSSRLQLYNKLINERFNNLSNEE